MSALEPIPTPASQRWREFKVRTLPRAVFGLAVVGAVGLWSFYVSPPMIMGYVEGAHANVSSTLAGKLTQVQVTRFKHVQSGDPVAIVITTDPKILEASLAVIRAEVDLIRADGSLAAQVLRSQTSIEQLRLEALRQRVELVQSRVSLTYAEAEYERVAKLFSTETNIASRAELDIALRDRDMLRAQVEENARLVAEMEKALETLRSTISTTAQVSGPEATLRAAIGLQEQKLRLTEAQMSPITLRAPIAGVVSMVYRSSGENIAAGEPLLTIRSDKPERIVAYLRQPLPFEPEIGGEAVVQVRNAARQRGVARVESVMPYMEPVPTNMALAVAVPTPLVALPLVLTLPPGLELRSGELVDVSIDVPKKRAAGAGSTSSGATSAPAAPK